MRAKGLFAVILVLFIAKWQASAQSEAVIIRGTASMLHLCQELTNLYQTELPQAKFGVNVSDSIATLPEGGGSIWQTVRPLDKAQREQLGRRFGSAAQEIPIAIEGAVVIVNRNNPITDLSVAQLRGIYLGKLTNWKMVGGKDAPIVLYSTEATVGGSLYFTDLVLHGEDIDTTMRGFVSPKETVRAVELDPNGIGLIPLPGDKDVKYPRIRRSADSPGIDASIENIRTLRYPLSSQVYWVVAGQHPEIVTNFLRFSLSPKGQLAAEATGYYPLNPVERIEAASLARSAGR